MTKVVSCVQCGRELLLYPGAVNYSCRNVGCPYGLFVSGYRSLRLDDADRYMLRLTFLMVLFIFVCMVCYFVGGLVEGTP